MNTCVIEPEEVENTCYLKRCIILVISKKISWKILLVEGTGHSSWLIRVNQDKSRV